ncbi:MAG: glycosyltransferase family 2 protein [candidate division Zixibacteria bacterium]|nr:glycosyltransferase family 2 protein [candidate division Zixibacteria bacterium]
MTRLSAVIITKNEEANIERCLRSVSWVDEIILVDSDSGDATVEIARSLGAKIFRPEWRGFGPTKQFAVEQAAGDWVLSIDADEEVSFTLKNEIMQLLEADPPCVGYMLPRKTQFLGRWILHSGWYPDYVLRLFKRSAGHFTPALVHEKVEVDGIVGKLHNSLLHYSYPTLEDFTRRQDQYSTLGALEMFDAGKSFRSSQLLFKPVLSFVRKFVFQKGWRDGWEGFLIAGLTANGTLLKYAKLRLLYMKAGKIKRP